MCTYTGNAPEIVTYFIKMLIYMANQVFVSLGRLYTPFNM